jgi:hypothetical protein
MKRILLLATIATLATAVVTSAHAGPNVNLDINVQTPAVHGPGVAGPVVYGRVTVGHVPPPVVLPQPVIIVPSRVAVVQQPIYLHVPAMHQTHWSRHCGAYAACSQPVYFVQDGWARTHGHHGRGGHAYGHGHGHAHEGHPHGKHAHKHANKHAGKHGGKHKRHDH